jgi:hypothetical protein
MSFGYIAWVPGNSSNQGSLPFMFTPNSTLNYTIQANTAGPPDGLAPLSLFLGAFPDMLETAEFDDICHTLPPFWNASFIQCILYNASYVANVSFVNGVQMIGTEINDTYNHVHYLAGLENLTISSDPSDPTYNTSVIENMAYQAVMDAFSETLVGTIITSIVTGGTTWGPSLTPGTDMAVTPLIHATEFNFLSRYLRIGAQYAETAASFQDAVMDDASLWNGSRLY